MFARRGKRGCPRITGWRFRRLQAAGTGRCARRAHYDSLRAAAARRLLACTLAAAREEGRHEVSPLLRITPFPLGGSRRLSICSEDLWHLLPQIRARFARKVRNTKAPAAHFPKATRRADSTPRGRALPLGWQPIPCLSQQQLGGRRKALLTLARAARPKGNGVDWQEGENRRCFPSCPRGGRASRIPAS